MHNRTLYLLTLLTICSLAACTSAAGPDALPKMKAYCAKNDARLMATEGHLGDPFGDVSFACQTNDGVWIWYEASVLR